MKSPLALYGGKKIRSKPFAPHPVMGPEEKKQVLSVLKTGKLSGFLASPGDSFLGGPKVKELEAAFRTYFKVEHAVAMNSATANLHGALAALGVGPGDEVLVPPYTMCASASAILMCGAIPVFVDIEPDTFCMDPKKIEARVSPQTKAVVVVHLYGQPADMDPIMAIAKKHKLKVVEDCAQSPKAKYKGRYAGTIGDIGVFSLNQNKTITTGEGGVAVTRNARLALRMQLIRNHGEVVVDHLPDAKGLPCLGWNYRMTELEASVGISQFRKLDKLTAHRVKLAGYLGKKLAAAEGLTMPVTRQGCTHVYFVYPVRYDRQKTGIPSRLFVKALGAEGVTFGAGYVRPIYLDSIYQNRRIYDNSNRGRSGIRQKPGQLPKRKLSRDG